MAGIDGFLGRSDERSQHCRLDGGAGSLSTAKLRTKFPANREFYREIRESCSRISVPLRYLPNLRELPSHVPIFLRNRTGNYHPGIREWHSLIRLLEQCPAHFTYNEARACDRERISGSLREDQACQPVGASSSTSAHVDTNRARYSSGSPIFLLMAASSLAFRFGQPALFFHRADNSLRDGHMLQTSLLLRGHGLIGKRAAGLIKHVVDSRYACFLCRRH